MKEPTQIINDIRAVLTKDKKLLIIAAISLLGVLLVGVSGLTADKKSENDAIAGNKNEAVFDESEYTKMLEKKLEAFVSSIEGAGKSIVVLTLECDYETVYAKDNDFSLSDGKSDGKSEYIILDTQNGEEGMLLLTVQPKVRGVAVACEGGSSEFLRGEISYALEALLNIGINRISVSKLSN